MSQEKANVMPRKRPRQARSRETVECLLEGAARVFRREGFGATTNRIAAEAGVGIGTLYDYFPNKQALLRALAERHLEVAECGIAAALARQGDTATRLAALQAAIVASQRYPSQAIALVTEAEAASALRRRAAALRTRVLAALADCARAADLPDPELRARAVFGVLAELASRAAYELSDEEQRALGDHWLAMSVAHLVG
jgi:AcrR family transcriptional regulator